MRYLDEAALRAMTGILSNPTLCTYLSRNKYTPIPTAIADLSYELAEAMLKKSIEEIKL